MGTRNNRFFPETVTEAHRSEWHPWLPRRGGWGHQELGRWEDIEGRYGGRRGTQAPTFSLLQGRSLARDHGS